MSEVMDLFMSKVRERQMELKPFESLSSNRKRDNKKPRDDSCIIVARKNIGHGSVGSPRGSRETQLESTIRRGL